MEDAVGAKVYIYHDQKMQFREVIVGKSYGIMNSTLVHFGLGKSTTIDSLKVVWPSGIEVVLDDIDQINSTLSISE